MAESFKFELVSPERLLLSEEVEAVTLPGTEGELTVMARHAPLMTTLKPGVISVQRSGATERYVVFGGFADILPDSCTVLAESAVAATEMNRADLARRIQEARDELAGAHDDAGRTRAEEFLNQLTTLENALLPA